MAFNYYKCLLTKNDCYKANKYITPTGIVVHSTGANNPYIKRYVQPDDGKLGKNTAGNDWNRGGTGACVNAFIGKLANGTIATYQTLPWNMRPWGCGSGSKGSYNNSHIQFEICEDALTDKKYFDAVMKEAINLCQYLIDTYKIPVKNVVSHAESHKLGYGTNHGDIDHWLKKQGKTMDWFRSQLHEYNAKQSSTTTKTTTTTKKAYSGAFPTLPSRGYFKKGDKGTQVTNLQKFLLWWDSKCLPKYGADGDCGDECIAAVKKFQKDQKLTQDGLFGKDCLTKAKAIKK